MLKFQNYSERFVKVSKVKVLTQIITQVQVKVSVSVLKFQVKVFKTSSQCFEISS